MFSISIIVALTFLVLLSVIDLRTFNLKEGSIPSVISTLFLIVMFLLNPKTAIVFGLFAGLVSLLFVDLDLFKGLADIKVFVALAMSFSVTFSFLFFSVLMIGLTIPLQLIVKYKFKKLKEIPLIPVMLLAYVVIVLFF